MLAADGSRFTKKATVAFMRIDPGLTPMLSIGTAAGRYRPAEAVSNNPAR